MDASDSIFYPDRFGKQLKASPPVLNSEIDPSWIQEIKKRLM
jgi:hypothetical protein